MQAGLLNPLLACLCAASLIWPSSEAAPRRSKNTSKQEGEKHMETVHHMSVASHRRWQNDHMCMSKAKALLHSLEISKEDAASFVLCVSSLHSYAADKYESFCNELSGDYMKADIQQLLLDVGCAEPISDLDLSSLESEQNAMAEQVAEVVMEAMEFASNGESPSEVVEEAVEKVMEMVEQKEMHDKALELAEDEALAEAEMEHLNQDLAKEMVLESLERIDLNGEAGRQGVLDDMEEAVEEAAKEAAIHALKSGRDPEQAAEQLLFAANLPDAEEIADDIAIEVTDELLKEEAEEAAIKAIKKNQDPYMAAETVLDGFENGDFLAFDAVESAVESVAVESAKSAIEAQKDPVQAAKNVLLAFPDQVEDLKAVEKVVLLKAIAEEAAETAAKAAGYGENPEVSAKVAVDAIVNL